MRIKLKNKAVWHVSEDGEEIEGFNGMPIERLLGKGEFGRVYKLKGKAQIGKALALKVLNRNKMRKSRDAVGKGADGRVVYMNGLEKLKREMQVLGHLQRVPVVASSEFTDSDEDEEDGETLKASDFPDVQSAIAAGFIPSSPSDRLSPVSSNLLRKSLVGGRPLPRPGVSSLLLGGAPATPQQQRQPQEYNTVATATTSSVNAAGSEGEGKNAYRKLIVPLLEVVDDEEDESVCMLFSHMPGGCLMAPGMFALHDGVRVQRYFAPADLSKASGSFLLVLAGEQTTVESLEGDDFHFGDHTGGMEGGEDIDKSSSGSSSSSKAKARFQRCDGFGASEVHALVVQLLLAVHFIHDKKVAHRDLKPENLLLDDKACLHLADFGCAELHAPARVVGDDVEEKGDDSIDANWRTVFGFGQSSNGRVRHTSGTPAFWAPECVQGALAEDGDNDNNNLVNALAEAGEIINLDGTEDNNEREGESGAFDVFAVDMWAVGLCLHAMLFNRLPFATSVSHDGQEEQQQDPMAMFADISKAEAVPAPLRKQSQTQQTQNQHPRARSVGGQAREGAAQDQHAAWAVPLLEGLLHPDPTCRLTAEEALLLAQKCAPL
jgi:serine/threonine protein kinase